MRRRRQRRLPRRLAADLLASAGGGRELRAHDVALHAFYPIPHAELPAVVGELRQIAGLAASLGDAPLAGAPLGVYAPLASSSPGAAALLPRLRELLSRYVRQERLTRLTVLGQDANTVAFAWILRGVERRSDDEPFAPIVIPQLGSAQQRVRLGGGDTIYLPEPVADLPAGFALALNGPNFGAAPIEERQAALRALVAIDNPTLFNETAQVLSEIARRYPPPP